MITNRTCRSFRMLWALFSGGCLASGLLLDTRALAEDRVDYLRDIKPLLAGKCYACHGALKQESDLRLDTAELAKQGGYSGAALVPGKPEESLILTRVLAAEGTDLMPPEGEGEQLQPEQVALLKTWIEQGAIAPEETPQPDPRQHWAYQPPRRPEVPATKDPAWVRNPIDSFIAAKYEAEQLVPAAPAAKHVLLRRVYLDLIGLPPTREQLAEFLADESPEAYEKVVDQLLASPRYGERWGRHWMDVWRYSDWSGFQDQIRNSQRHIWHWRDWIVESLNEDKPYDRMVVEMLAGDEIAPTDENTLRATGFLARSWFKFNRNTWLESTVEHTSKAFLGVTINCAKCHDHKYDPLTQKEFYQFRAIFEPYDVRTDRTPGEADLMKAGLPRVYDAHAETPTYLFIRGSEIAPDKEHPLAPAAPKALGGELRIEPVTLPEASYYPHLADFIVKETLAAADAKVRESEEALNKARQAHEESKQKLSEFLAKKASEPPAEETGEKLDDLLEAPEKTKPAAVQAAKEELAATGAAKPAEEQPKPPTKADLELTVKNAESAMKLCEAQFAASKSEKTSLAARIAADRATHARPVPENLVELKQAAAVAEHALKLSNAKVTLLTAQGKLAEAESTKPKEDPKQQAEIAKLKSAVEAAEKGVADCKKSLTAMDKFTPLGTSYPTQSTGRRTALARWIADRQNPLTARVAVNHIWLRHIGSPLVPNVFDFGLRSPRPEHAELLDWLAVEFMESGWSMKHLHRLIVTSNLYQLSSVAKDAPAENAARDQDNHFLWRMNSRRLEAEAVRDSVLHVAGNLDMTMGGPDIDFREGQTSLRRSIYFRHAYEKQMKFLELFDAASVNECYRRGESIVPQQALALSNSKLSLAQARLMARALDAEIKTESKPADSNPTETNPTATNRSEAFVRLAFQQILNRDPSSEELADCREFLTSQAELLSNASQLTPFTSSEKATVPPAEDPTLRAKENLIHVLLNHNDFVTIR